MNDGAKYIRAYQTKRLLEMYTEAYRQNWNWFAEWNKN